MTKNNNPHIVVLGAGFGGLYAVKNLRKILPVSQADITVINKNNYFLFTPMLHEAATGGIGRHQVVESLREIFLKDKIKLVVSEATSIDLGKKTISTKSGKIKYDYLIIATGSGNNFYNIKGAEENALTLKNLADVNEMRNRFIDVFEKASQTSDLEKRKQLLTFGVVGGGPTGVELVAEMAELFWDNMVPMYDQVFSPSEVRLYLFSADPNLIPMCHVDMRSNVMNILEEKKIDVHLSSFITEISKEGVTLRDGSFIPMKTVVWAAGVKPNTPKFNQSVTLDSAGRIRVDNFLEVTGYPDVYAIGDVASFMDQKSGKPLPMLAQVAVREAKTVAYNIKAKITGSKPKKFTYHSLGMLVSVGQWKAVADVCGFRFNGKLAWALWRIVYLFKFISGEKKFKIATDWIADAFSYRDITKA